MKRDSLFRKLVHGGLACAIVMLLSTPSGAGREEDPRSKIYVPPRQESRVFQPKEEPIPAPEGPLSAQPEFHLNPSLYKKLIGPSKIAFAAQFPAANNWDIAVMDPDGSNIQQLTSHPADDIWPAWSPDCSKIAFLSDRPFRGGVSGWYYLYIMNSNGSGVTRLTQSAASIHQRPAWSPDGSRIAFNTDMDIFLINPDGSNETQLTDHNQGSEPYFAKRPDWSPNGKQIVFIRQEHILGDFALGVMNSDGTNPTLIIIDNPNLPVYYSHKTAVTWSPDGSKIAIPSLSILSPVRQTVLANIDGSDSRKLLDITEHECDWPSWSPSGNQIACLGWYQDDSWKGIIKINVDGSGVPIRLVKDAKYPAWSPNCPQ